MAEFDKYAAQYEELLRDPIRDKFVPRPAFFFERKWNVISDFARSALPPLKQLTWLDVGCGKGELLRLGSPHVKKAYGCDVSTGMLGNCTDLAITLQTDPARLPFSDTQFDLITAVCVYHHVTPTERLALTKEIARALKPGGIACIMEHNPFNPATRWIVRRAPVDVDAQLLTASRSEFLLASGGLEVLQTSYFLYFPESLYGKLHRVERLLAKVPAGGQYATFASKRR